MFEQRMIVLFAFWFCYHFRKLQFYKCKKILLLFNFKRRNHFVFVCLSFRFQQPEIEMIKICLNLEEPSENDVPILETWLPVEHLREGFRSVLLTPMGDTISSFTSFRTGSRHLTES